MFVRNLTQVLLEVVNYLLMVCFLCFSFRFVCFFSFFNHFFLYFLVIEAQKINLSKDLGHLGVYCVLTMDKQQVRTQVVEDFKNLRWNEGFFLYGMIYE